MSLLLCCSAYLARAGQASHNIICRPELATSLRHEMADKLRRITGWQDLGFDDAGALLLGRTSPTTGSQTARDLLTDAMAGKNLMILEDASNRQDVVFCRVIEGRWKTAAQDKPPVYVILIDFADFNLVMGDKAALAAFNVGWGVLHEIDHVVHDSADPAKEGVAGECEGLINRMRRECGQAERADYYFSFVPGTANSGFMTKFVRIAFDQRRTGSAQKKRYWLIWDATLVGGLDEQRLLAARL